MKYWVRVPVERRGLFGRKKIVCEERTVEADGRTYRRMTDKQRNRETDEFMDFVEEMEMIDEIIDD